MSCNLVSDTLISALVTAAAKFDTHGQLPAPDWATLARDNPKAFARPATLRPSTLRESVAKTYPNEIGRALALTNFESVNANYSGRHTSDADRAEALAFRHQATPLRSSRVIKQIHTLRLSIL